MAVVLPPPLGPIGNIPLAEAEAKSDAALQQPAMAQ